MSKTLVLFLLLFSGCAQHDFQKASPDGKYLLSAVESKEGAFVRTFVSVSSTDGIERLTKFEIARDGEDETHFLTTFFSASWINDSVFAFVQAESWNFKRTIFLKNNASEPIFSWAINTPNNRFVVVDLKPGDTVSLPIGSNSASIDINGEIHFQSGKVLQIRKSSHTPPESGLRLRVDDNDYQFDSE